MVSAIVRRLPLTVLFFAMAIPLVSQAGDDRPASVSNGAWIPLGDKAGIVITSPPSRAGGKPAGEAKGELWVKLDGRWTPATLEQAHQFVPAR